MLKRNICKQSRIHYEDDNGGKLGNRTLFQQEIEIIQLLSITQNPSYLPTLIIHINDVEIF